MKKDIGWAIIEKDNHELNWSTDPDKEDWKAEIYKTREIARRHCSIESKPVKVTIIWEGKK